MKLTCAILILGAILYSVAGNGHGHGHHPGREKFKQSINECVGDDSKLNETVKQIFRNEQKEDETVDDDVKCVFKCFMEKMGSMDENGNIVVPEDVNGKPHFAKIFDACKDAEGDDPCEKAYNFQKCFNKNRPPKPHNHHH